MSNLENYYSRLADEAEEGVKRHYLLPVFRSPHSQDYSHIRPTNPSHHHSSNRSDVPMLRDNGQPCRSIEETRSAGTLITRRH